jgi:tripartite-type tricarboxylate transporter receptor subunit TctC
MRKLLTVMAAAFVALGCIGVAAAQSYPTRPITMIVADDLKGLIAWLTANPDKASVGIAGVGATGHLTGIAFQKESGTKFQFVPYRGNAPAMQDLLAGQIDS